jgi:hypothetical protein
MQNGVNALLIFVTERESRDRSQGWCVVNSMSWAGLVLVEPVIDVVMTDHFVISWDRKVLRRLKVRHG